jgi:hypothetical protein
VAYGLTSPVAITESLVEGDDGVKIPCVSGECLSGMGTVGPIWGDGPDLVKRVLATLTEECDCGADWHYNWHE